MVFLVPTLMKGTKVLTLGAGRGLAPQHGKDDIYTRPLAIRMRGTVNWWAGLSILPTRGLLAC